MTRKGRTNKLHWTANLTPVNKGFILNIDIAEEISIESYVDGEIEKLNAFSTRYLESNRQEPNTSPLMRPLKGKGSWEYSYREFLSEDNF